MMSYHCVGVDLCFVLIDKHLNQWRVSVLSSKVKWRHAELTLGTDVRLVIQQHVSHLLVSSLRGQVQRCFAQLQTYDTFQQQGVDSGEQRQILKWRVGK